MTTPTDRPGSMKDPDASQTNDAVTELNGGGMSTGIGFFMLPGRSVGVVIGVEIQYPVKT